jgi:ribosomal protein S18 acetylase RimI-like enzyme
MELTFEWKTGFDEKTATAYLESLSTLIGEAGAQRLLEVAKIYESHDWFRLLVANDNKNVAGMLALYFEPIHGSHEGWICTHPKYRIQNIGDKIQGEFEESAFENGIRIFRADATLAYVHSQKFLYRRDYKAVGYVPMSFSFLPGKSLGSALMVWKIFDPTLKEQWENEKRQTLEWEDSRWKCDETGEKDLKEALK